MGLLELCEPLFQYICRLNRTARKGGMVDVNQTDGEVRAILENIARKANADPRLSVQWREIELPVLFFIDFTVKNHNSAWQELAFERNELAGDQKFWELLDDTLKQRDEAASERLAVFYTCVGLGFTGWNAGQPEELRKKMLEMSARIRGIIDADTMSRICPESYERLNTANLIEPPGRSLFGIVLALVVLVGVLFAGNVYLYNASSSELSGALTEIKQFEPKAPAGTPPAGSAGSSASATP